MKTVKTLSLFVVALLILISCSKSSTTPPSVAETNATLLAGSPGGSKTWTITKVSQTKNGSDNGHITPGDGTFPDCESDNLYKFSNNSSQDYQVTEGAVNCNPGTDPSTIEAGAWAFTKDGKSLIVDGAVYPTSTQFNDPNEPFLGFLILNQSQALKVVQLTSTVLVVSYSFSNSTDNYVMTLYFAKV